MARRVERAPKIVSLEDVNERHPGEWVLLRVVELDEDGDIVLAEILKHSKSRAAISRSVGEAHDADPMCHLSVFLGGTRRVSGNELREALSRVAEDEYVNARW
jgi:hypothetical protein